MSELTHAGCRGPAYCDIRETGMSEEADKEDIVQRLSEIIKTEADYRASVRKHGGAATRQPIDIIIEDARDEISSLRQEVERLKADYERMRSNAVRAYAELKWGCDFCTVDDKSLFEAGHSSSVQDGDRGTTDGPS